jgi:dimeric dUTPase (all-alpha-NTP-PPase superfamily)
MNLNELFSRQAELDNRIVEEHKLHDQDLKKRKILAGIVELAETANEGRWFKFWSKDQKARTFASDSDPTAGLYREWNPLLEEYTDVIHFVISVALEYGYTEHAYAEPKQTDLTDRALDIVYLLSSLPYIQEKVRHRHIRLIFDYVIALGEQFGFTEQMVIDAYYEKNKENFRRQEVGY